MLKYRIWKIHFFRVSKELLEAHAHQVWSPSGHEKIKATIFLTYQRVPLLQEETKVSGWGVNYTAVGTKSTQTLRRSGVETGGETQNSNTFGAEQPRVWKVNGKNVSDSKFLRISKALHKP